VLAQDVLERALRQAAGAAVRIGRREQLGQILGLERRGRAPVLMGRADGRPTEPPSLATEPDRDQGDSDEARDRDGQQSVHGASLTGP
jgi:hypothetical protein